MVRRILLLLAALSLVASACNGDPVIEDIDDPIDDVPEEAEYDVSDQPDDASAWFVSPSDGDTVSSPVQIVLDAEGVDIVPAGAPAVGEAHFHFYVDIGCFPEGELVPGPSPEDEAAGIFHMGDGSTERELELEPGTYELCVQLADGIHQTFGATDTIEITVE